nr:PREDICTED: ubiquitin-conjugating enzyme E2 D4 isoform X5 [Equus przewalskii]
MREPSAWTPGSLTNISFDSEEGEREKSCSPSWIAHQLLLLNPKISLPSLPLRPARYNRLAREWTQKYAITQCHPGAQGRVGRLPSHPICGKLCPKESQLIPGGSWELATVSLGSGALALQLPPVLLCSVTRWHSPLTRRSTK